MIVFVATRPGLHTFRLSWSKLPGDLRRRIRLSSYGDLVRRSWLPSATYVFADIERLAPDGARRAASVWRALAESGQPVRLLNHPMRSLRRYPLLRALFERGINDFNVYRGDEAGAQIRYPVFLRDIDDHRGARTGLVADPAALEAALRQQEARGRPRHSVLIVEFCDTRDERGLYRKYDAWVAGDRIVATDTYFSSRWMLKWENSYVFDGIPVDEEALTVQELAYVNSSLGHEFLGEVCALAQIEYGRVDFGFLGDRIQIWEINTNPTLALGVMASPDVQKTPYGRLVLPQVLDAIFTLLRSLDLDSDARIRIPLPPAPAAWAAAG